MDTNWLRKLRLTLGAVGVDDEFALHIVQEYNRMRLGGRLTDGDMELVMRRWYNRDYSTIRREYSAYRRHKTDRFMDS